MASESHLEQRICLTPYKNTCENCIIVTLVSHSNTEDRQLRITSFLRVKVTLANGVSDCVFVSGFNLISTQVFPRIRVNKLLFIT